MEVALFFDDKKYSYEIERLIKNIKDNYIFTHYSNYIDLINECKKYKIVFLEAEYNNVNIDGIRIAQKIRENNFNNYIIYLSDADKYARMGYNVGAYAYLNRNITTKKIIGVLNGIEKLEDNKRVIFAGEDRKCYYTLLSDIKYIEACKNGSKIYTSDSVINCRELLKDIIKKIPGKYFYQINRSQIIALGKIKEVNDLVVTFTSNENFTVARRRYRDFESAYCRYI